MVLPEGKELCIYCRGDYALRAYFQLREGGIPVACFADKDENKQGYVIDGVCCISYEEFLQKDREKTIVLVCKQHPEQLMSAFKKRGFLHVGSYKDLQGMERAAPGVSLNAETVNKINFFRLRLHQMLSGMQEGVEKSGSKDAFCAALERILWDVQDRRAHGVIEYC